MSRIIFAIDVTTSVVSLARIAETDGPATPVVSWVDPPSQGGSHRPRVTWEKNSLIADAVADKVLAAGVPAVVVMAKQLWGPVSVRKQPGAKRSTIQADPSAGRRIAIHALIEDRLHRAGVPVAEFPYPTALRWARGFGEQGGTQNIVMRELTDFAGKHWGIVPRTELGKDGRQHTMPFRPAVAVLAAIGAQAVGVEVEGIDVTETRLKIAAGTDQQGMNRAIQWPAGMLPPETVAAWELLHSDPGEQAA